MSLLVELLTRIFFDGIFSVIVKVYLFIRYRDPLKRQEIIAEKFSGDPVAIIRLRIVQSFAVLFSVILLLFLLVVLNAAIFS